jgi:hypothetical protein
MRVVARDEDDWRPRINSYFVTSYSLYRGTGVMAGPSAPFIGEPTNVRTWIYCLRTYELIGIRYGPDV